MKLVIVKFIDPTTWSGWTKKEEVCKSLPHGGYAGGWLVEQPDPTIVKVALLVSGNLEDHNSWVDIPAGVVEYVKEIQEVELEKINE